MKMKVYIQSQQQINTQQINLLWSWLVLIKNPESAISESERRTSQNVFDSEMGPSKTGHETGHETKTNLE